MPTRLDTRSPEFDAGFQAFLGAKREVSQDVEAAARGIIADVVARGDAALVELTRKFDRGAIHAGTLRVSAAELDAAQGQCDPKAVDALKFARDRIEAYHRRQLPKDERFTDALGVELGYRWTAISAAVTRSPGRGRRPSSPKTYPPIVV